MASGPEARFFCRRLATEMLRDTLARSRHLEKVDPARSRQMALVKSKNTKPEIVVRRLVHSLGYRFRLHRRNLPGAPDLVFPSRRKVIFVHGCFWHQHDDPTCWRSRLPKTRQDFWAPKLVGNAARDKRDIEALNKVGWAALVVWECQTITSKKDQLAAGIKAFLGPLTAISS
jgi:DNA mismatch endonuclease (patch repair protein)